METTLKKFFTLVPESMRELVSSHAQELDSATADYLSGELDQYLKVVAGESRKNTCINLPLVERMVASLRRLLEEFAHFPDEDRMVISAAVRYFLDCEDEHQDFSDRFGFDDDLAVLNAALLAIGREDLLVIR